MIKAAIKGISTVFYIFLILLFALVSILGAMQLFAHFWSLMGWSGEVVEFVQHLPHDRGTIVRSLTIPDFFRVGDTNMFHYAIRDMGGAGLRVSFRTVANIAMLFTAMRMFRLLSKGEVPFSKGVVHWFTLFTICYVFWSSTTNLATASVGIVIVAVGLIFKYGRLLQDESDTTL